MAQKFIFLKKPFSENKTPKQHEFRLHFLKYSKIYTTLKHKALTRLNNRRLNTIQIYTTLKRI